MTDRIEMMLKFIDYEINLLAIVICAIVAGFWLQIIVDDYLNKTG